MGVSLKTRLDSWENCNLMVIYVITQQIDNQLVKFMFVIIDVVFNHRTSSHH